MPRRRTATLTALTTLVALVALGVWLHARSLSGPATEHPLTWWMLAAGFAITELGVVHVHFRRSAFSLTLGEIPLVLGLLFADPSAIPIAWAVGVGVVLLRDRCPPQRLLFNLAQLALAAGLAVAVLHALADGVDASQPRTWATVAAAVLVSGIASSLLIAFAMALGGEKVTARRVPRMLGVAALAATTNVSMGLAVAVVLAGEAAATLLLAAPAVALYVTYRAYEAQRTKSMGLEFLYEAARALARAGDAAAGVAGMLALALDTFRAGTAELVMFGDEHEEDAWRVAVGPDEKIELGGALEPTVASELRSLVGDDLRARLIARADAGPALRRHLAAAGVDCAMLAGLPGERGGTIGSVLVANRVGLGGGFDQDDLRLFGTLAAHAGATLGHERLEQRVSQLHHQAFHDPLTGLANRMLFEDRVAHALARRGGNVIVLYIDLDEFKPVNDRYGHDAGDALLCEVAARLRESLREADTPARLGGDEFAVLLTDVAPADVHTVTRRILGRLGEPCRVGDDERPIWGSIGVAIAESGSTSPEELVRRADAAMYLAKHGGRHRYTVYGSDQVAPAAA